MSDVSGISRRDLLAGVAAGAATLGIGSKVSWADDPWAQAATIANNLVAPATFPGKRFLVTAYGAVAGGATDNYAAFNNAIKACNAAGGGKVVVPAGTWYIAGSIFLLSNVNFHLNDGATILFSNDPQYYAKYGAYGCGVNGNLSLVRWQGNDCLNYTPLVYAYGQSNIAITGDGTAILNGQATTTYTGTLSTSTPGWLMWKTPSDTVNSANYTNTSGGAQYATINATYGIPTSLETTVYGSGTSSSLWYDEYFLPALAEAGVPATSRIFGLGHWLRPSFVHFYACTNVQISGITLYNSPMWQIHPCRCTNVLISNCTVANANGGAGTVNGDGCDPESCTNVLIDGCYFYTGDDPIAIKAGKGADSGYPCSNIVVQNCFMYNSPGGVTIGSEESGGVSNVYVQNITIDKCTLCLRIKSNFNRGGTIQNIYYRNISIPEGNSLSTNYPIFWINSTFSATTDAVRTRAPVIKNINVTNLQASAYPGHTQSCYNAIYVDGPDASEYDGTGTITATPATNITISNSNFGTTKATTKINRALNASNVVLSNVTWNGTTYNETINAGTSYVYF